MHETGDDLCLEFCTQILHRCDIGDDVLQMVYTHCCFLVLHQNSILVSPASVFRRTYSVKFAVGVGEEVWMEKTNQHDLLFPLAAHVKSTYLSGIFSPTPTMATRWAWPMRGWRWPYGSVVFLVGKDLFQKFGVFTIILSMHIVWWSRCTTPPPGCFARIFL